MKSATIVREMTPADFPSVLALNHEWEHFLSPLTPSRLEQLYREAAYHRVVEEDGKVTAFLLAFREDAEYDSPNYQWFTARYDRFLYIDRVVVAREHKRRGLGSHLYEDLFEFARASRVPRVTCEFYTDPPNEESKKFHARYGFEQVGTQTVFGTKHVSLQSLLLNDIP
jgi:predicted GNAT superfamily acetyltransferase